MTGVGIIDDGMPASSPTLVGELAGMYNYAREVADAERRLPDSVSADVNGLRDQVVKTAAEMAKLADGPVTIGVVGEFSAGKSLLLGLLLGAPDLLPVGDDATTANVTALHLTEGPADKPTTIEIARVQYLSMGSLDDCLRHLVDELVLRAEAAGLPPEARQAVHALHPGEQFWPALESWCRDVAWPTQDARLTLLVRELMRLRDAVTYATPYLGWTTDVEPQVFRTALHLPSSDPDPSTFPRPHIPAVDLSARPGQLAPEQLRATLPLVERVTLDVRVPQHVWDLSELRGHNQLVLLDFPGLNSTISGVRDRYLSRRELAGVTTIFILLNAQAAGSAGPTEFPAMMSRKREDMRDRVLVGIGRFDQLPNLITPDLYRGSESTARVTDRRLVDEVLRAVVSNARLLVGTDHDERILFHSAMVGIDALNRRQPGRAHYSSEFEASRRLAEHIPRALAEAEKWGRIADRLRVDDPASTLRPALAAFSIDGGVQRIRERLESHVKAHGLDQRLADLDKEADKLEEQLQLLVHACRDFSAEAESRAAREPVELLLEAVRQQLGDLKDRAANELGDPRHVRLPDGTSLAEAVERRAVDEVFSWPEWSRLFEAVQDGVIASRIVDPHPLPFDDDDDEDPVLGLPVTTSEFAQRFAHAVSTCEQYALEQAWKALDDWVRRANVGLGRVRESLPSVIDADAERRIRKQFGDRGFPRRLAGALDLGWLPSWAQEAAEKQLAKDGSADTVDPAAAFPLRMDAGFAWDPDAPMEVREAAVAALARHQIRPARLRRELVNGVVAVVFARLGILQIEIARSVTDGLQRTRTGLDRSDQYVDAVLGVTEASHVDPAAELAAIRRPPKRPGPRG